MPDCILITGSTGLIGKYLTGSFQKKNKEIIGVTRNILKNKESLVSGVKYIELDLSDISSLEKNMLENETTFDDVSYVINCARSASNLRLFQNKDYIGGFKNEFELSVLANFIIAKTLKNISPALRSICNVSSIYSERVMTREYYEKGQILPINYGVSKAALNHLTREMANDFGQDGIAVNSVLFGGVFNENSRSFVNQYTKDCSMNGMLNIRQTFPIIEFLENAAEAGITGQCINVDNGYKL